MSNHNIRPDTSGFFVVAGKKDGDSKILANFYHNLDTIQTVPMLPMLPEWSEYLWTVGQMKKLASEHKYHLGGMTGYIFNATSDTGRAAGRRSS